MNSKMKYEMMKEDYIDKESIYLCTEIERALDRIVNYSDNLDDKSFTKIKNSAIKLLKEWHL